MTSPKSCKPTQAWLGSGMDDMPCGCGGAGCCSSLNGFRKRGPTVEALSQGYEAVMETHLNSLHRRLPRTCRRETEGASREAGGCEGDMLQPSRVVRRAFRGNETLRGSRPFLTIFRTSRHEYERVKTFVLTEEPRRTKA